MIHEMRLNQGPFDKVRSGRKDIELRLNDEKRRKLNAGDDIVFLERDTDQRFTVRIVAIHHAPSFMDLFKSIDLTRTGCEPGATPEMAAAQMRRFYSEEEEKASGVVGIEMKVT